MATPVDASAHWDSTHLIDPERTYLVATTPRTGSTWLCDALRDTGRLGAPFEYFNTVAFARFADRIGVPRPRPRARVLQLRNRMHHQPLGRQLTTWRTPASMRSYVRWLQAHRVSANGTFGSKLHRDEQQRVLASTGLDVFDLVGARRVVWLRRHDRTRQAISLYRARATNRWHTTDGPTGRPQPAFDADAIRTTVAELTAEDDEWAEELARRRLPVHQIHYEDLTTDRDAVLSACFSFLGCPGTPVPAPTLGKVSDDTTDDWVERLQQAG